MLSLRIVFCAYGFQAEDLAWSCKGVAQGGRGVPGTTVSLNTDLPHRKQNASETQPGVPADSGLTSSAVIMKITGSQARPVSDM